ncbi:hypothetical protein [Proteus mirabilis]|uniref:hypothetical protein n=1 Tax=Proteus mirabilis TaxID=584 RepID=UPI000A7A969A|nr:hypothetical protein [Proteus mirabilis]
MGDKSTNNRNNSLSIGSNDNQRQIVNVAAGTENTDAVNVAQLKKESQSVLKEADNHISDNNEKIYNEIQKEKEFIINDTKNQINENNNTIKSYIDNTNSLTLKKVKKKPMN